MNQEEYNKPILSGTPASSGVAEGTVKVVEGVKDIPDFKEGYVLVTRMTEPSMVIMMNKAAAIITDVGGITCHAAIVSRELGIPCVVATLTATTDLKDGVKVRVDGDKGKVYMIS